MLYSKEKDASPLETVQKIKELLKKAELFPQESEWVAISNNDNSQPAYIKRVFIQTMELGTNGKGTTKEYCLASAYGELIERLENIYLGMHLDVNIPDAKNIAQSDFLKGNTELADEKFFRYLFQSDAREKINNNLPLYEIISRLQGFASIDPQSDIKCVPFYKANENSIKYLPLEILTRINSTNGMVAGNTIEEAFIQGASEIIERYVQKRIYIENLMPPLIPENEYTKFDELNKLIEFFNSMGILIQVRDASLNENWPAVCVIFINSTKGEYTVKFAANPSLPIAIERCFTEYIQCNDLQNNTYSTPHYSPIERKNFFEEELYTQDVIFNAYAFPFNPEMFKNKTSWDYNPEIWNTYNENNKTNAKVLMSLFMEKSFDVYIRDVSFLGFPALHIHIPEMSNFIINMPMKFEKEINAIRKYWQNNLSDYSFKYVIPTVFQFNNELNLAINLTEKNHIEAEKYLNKIIEKTLDYNEKLLLKCLKEYLKFKQDGWSDEDAKNTMTLFFGSAITEQIFQYCIYNNYLDNVVAQIIATIRFGLQQENTITTRNIMNDITQKLSIQYCNNIPVQKNLAKIF